MISVAQKNRLGICKKVISQFSEMNVTGECIFAWQFVLIYMPSLLRETVESVEKSVGVCRGDTNYKFVSLVPANITVNASVRLNGGWVWSILRLLSFLYANRQRKVVLRAPTDWPHPRNSTSGLFMNPPRAYRCTGSRSNGILARDMLSFVRFGGGTKARVAQAGQRFNLGSLRVFGSQSSPSIGIIVVDLAAKLISSEAYF